LAEKQKFEVLILGRAPQTGPYAAEFFELIKTRPWCRHGGFVGRAELKEHLRETALLVLPSLEENCPMAILEAMAAGVAVAAGRAGGVPDLIHAAKSGFL